MLKILKEYRLSVINDPNRDEPVILNTDELDNKINTCIDKLKFGIDSKDIFMDLIFDIQYHKSFGRYLYEKLNKGYLDKLSKSEIEYLSPSIINKININILINIILDFFKGRFLK
jgi:UDP-galactopyranose mutase